MTTETTAFVAKTGDKFTATVGTQILGSSKHADYFEYHMKKGDVKALRESGITHIAYVDDAGTVTKTVSVVKTSAVKDPSPAVDTESTADKDAAVKDAVSAVKDAAVKIEDAAVKIEEAAIVAAESIEALESLQAA